MEGWIKLHRKIMNWEWYNDSKMFHLLFHLIMSANHEDGNWQGIKVKRGQLITGRKSLSVATGISEQSIRTCLEKLVNTKELTIKTTNKYSVITILNYNIYQSIDKTNQQINHQLTNNQPSTNHQLTTNKNDKNDKNDKNENIYRSFNHLSITKDEVDKLLEDHTQSQVDSILDQIENYKKNNQYKSLYLTAKNWLKKEPKKTENNKAQFASPVI